MKSQNLFYICKYFRKRAAHHIKKDSGLGQGFFDLYLNTKILGNTSSCHPSGCALPNNFDIVNFDKSADRLMFILMKKVQLKKIRPTGYILWFW